MADNKTNMVDNEIIFRMGEETGIVIEKAKEQFEHSLFKEQYRQAFGIMDTIIERSNPEKGKAVDDKMSNIIVFCGDRGEGKTSALETVRGILSDKIIYDNAKAAHLITDETRFDINSFKVLNMVDPAFFDDKHNLMELLVGQMYADILKDDRAKACNDEYNPCRLDLNVVERNNLIQYFHQVRDGLRIIHKPSEKSAYDNLEEIDELAAGIELKEKVNQLLKCYAKYFKKERVLICIDDLDLNATEGYTMAEEIRKYLSSPSSCVVLMAVKIEQMIEVVQSYLRENLSKIVLDDTIKEMAVRYVTKLLPQSHRVWMPTGSILADSKLHIYEGNTLVETFSSVKEALVRLIFRKTRYIFVNGRNISPIVPSNLRELRLLWETLWILKDGEKNDENHIKNKAIFKHYFYNVWIKQLGKDIDFATSLVQNQDLISINKSIVTYLGNNYANILGIRLQTTNGTQEKTLLNAILEPSNPIQNVSTGDLLYLINAIESLTADERTHKLSFFIKAFYSITLYESYDIATIDKEHLYALSDESQISIYKYDRLYRKMNALQRVVNGAYFTYSSGDILTKESNTLKARDIRYINPQVLKNIYDELSSTPKDAITDYEQKLNTLEFFALTITYDAYSGEDQKDSYRRSLTSPLYLTPIRPKASFVNFDVLSIFYNIINIKHTYDRWNDFYKVDNVDEQTGSILSDNKTEEEQEAEEKEMQKKPSLFEIAQKNDESLYNKMMTVCSEDYKDEEEKYAPEHYLISDASIRFIDVQLAIMDLALNNKRIHRVKSNKLNIRLLYDDIQTSKISLYPLKEGQRRYELKFKFLRPICDFLNSISETEFDKIFSPKISNYKPSDPRYDLRSALSFIASKLDLPADGINVRNQISKHFHEFYMGCGGATYWNQLLQKDKIYDNIVGLLPILQESYKLQTTFMKNAEKLIPPMITSPLF